MKICILMSTYNGEKNLREQIESILSQRGVDISIWVRDDGSTDGTKAILEEYRAIGLLNWYSGKNLGPAMSFMELVKTAPKAELYAFCDQDDVWLPSKLSIAVEKLTNFNNVKPALYFSEVTPVNNNLGNLHYDKLNPKVDIFAEVIMNYAFGCTMVFNSALRRILICKKVDYVVMHDWWIYLVCLAVDGNVIYDDDSNILYRQHELNASGIKETFIKQFKRRLVKVLLKKDNRRSKMLKTLYENYYADMDQEKRELILLLVNYDKSVKNKLLIFNDKRLCCGRKGPDRMFRLSILINRY